MVKIQGMTTAAHKAQTLILQYVLTQLGFL